MGRHSTEGDYMNNRLLYVIYFFKFHQYLNAKPVYYSTDDPKYLIICHR